MQGRFARVVGLSVAGVVLAAACQTGGAAPTTPAATQPAGSQPAGSQPAETQGGGGETSFSVAFTSLGLSSGPFLSALDKLAEQGYTIETPELAESELVTEGVASGQFQFGSGANNAVLTANAAGANLQVLVDRVMNEWTLYARTETTSECADLADQRLAIHSEGAVSTAMVRDWIEQTCAGTEPEYIVIEGSPNRLAALIADEIDASPLELGDSVALEAEAGDRFSLLTSFSEDLPDLHPTSIYVNGDWAAENPEVVTDVVRAVVEEYRLIEGDAEYLQQVAEEQLGDAVSAETIAEAAALYVERGMFPVDGGLTEENLQFTAEFFQRAGAIEEVPEASEWSDLSYLQTVLDELGG